MKSKRVVKFANIPKFDTNGWRHTHASMLFESGVRMKEAQERLRHSSINMTMNIYTHLSEKSKKETVIKLAKFANFWESRSKSRSSFFRVNKKSSIPSHARDKAGIN